MTKNKTKKFIKGGEDCHRRKSDRIRYPNLKLIADAGALRRVSASRLFYKVAHFLGRKDSAIAHSVEIYSAIALKVLLNRKPLQKL